MSEPVPTTPSEPRRPWQSKWRFIGVYWLVQALVLHTAAIAMLDGDPIPSLQRILRAWVEPDVLAMSAIFVLIVTVCQAVILLPVRRPADAPRSAGARFLHCAVAGLAVGSLTWLAFWPIAGLADLANMERHLEFAWRTPLAWLIPVTTGLLTTVYLWCSTKGGIPVRLSVLLAALAAAMLLTGLVAAAWSIPRLIVGDPDRFEKWLFGSMCGTVLIGWAVATPLVYTFIRRRGAEDGLATLSSRLFLGTILEAAAVIPLDVMVRRKSSCYCGEGTFWTLAACWAVGAFALGPVIFLVPLSRRRKRWYAGRCEACGYDMRGCMTAERCPECGAGWKPAKAPTSGC